MLLLAFLFSSQILHTQTRPSPAAAFVVVLDPAHGGADSGAHLSDGATEKDVTLALANRLRNLLEERGFTVIMTRNSDADLSDTQRAALANRAHAQACLLLHATSSGSGIHLFNSSLAPADATAPHRSFTPWETAQAGSITRSIALAAEINAAFSALTGRNAIPVTLGRTYLRPMDSLTCAAVAVEVAPLNAKDPHDRKEADSPDSIDRVARTLAWSLQQWRSHSTGAPQMDDSLNPAHADAGGKR